MKIKTSIITASLLLATNIYGAEKYATKQNYFANKWRVTEANKKITKLENEIEALKALLKKQKTTETKSDTSSINKKLNNLIQQFNDLKSEIEDYDLEDISDRLDETETMVLQDKIFLSLGFKTRMDNYKRTMADCKTQQDFNVWSEKLYLNMKSKISDNMKFSGRLSMQKYWADSGNHQYTYFDSMQGRTNDADSTLYVERAYIDWRLNPTSAIPITLTIGRQPSSDGPSFNIMDNTTRKSTYSALTFDGAADGLVSTFNTSKYISNSNFKLAYGKGFQEQEFGNLSDTNVGGILFETSLSNKIAKSSLFQVGYVIIRDMVADMSGMAGANHTDPNTDNIGDMDLYGVMLELHQIYNSKLDAFVHIGLNRVKPNGEVMALDINGDGVVDGNYGLLTNTAGDTEVKNGHAFWVGAKYSINKFHQVGLEYNQGSKNWIAMTQGGHDPYNKLSTRGNAIEGYYNYIVNRNSFVRFGIVDINYKYTGSSYHIGTPMEIESLPDAYKSSTVKRLTDYYITLNILF
jgi:hypothetical protein